MYRCAGAVLCAHRKCAPVHMHAQCYPLHVHMHCTHVTILFFSFFFLIGSLKKWRRRRQRQCHKSMIWLVEWEKIIVLHVRHAFWCNFLTVWRREIFIFEDDNSTCSSKSFILCQAKQTKVHFAYFFTTWDNHKTLNLTQSSILMWRFLCSSRRSFLNSLISLFIRSRDRFDDKN